VGAGEPLNPEIIERVRETDFAELFSPTPGHHRTEQNEIERRSDSWPSTSR
jgi:hypothetical protein